jgi:S-methylmethionine-dependent homocysteine/selenocysteine methylase
MPPLADRLSQGRPLVLDGAMGTELDHRGVRTFLPLWSAWGLIERPEMVAAIHFDYATAGADILTTNTFSTTRRMLERAGREGDEAEVLDGLAVQLAREGAATAGSDALIAGSIAPLEDCYSPWLSPGFDIALSEHRVQAAQLAEAGADFIMIETMPLIEEAEAAARAALETGLEVTVGFVLGADGRLLSGESLSEAVQRLVTLPIAAVFVNCSPPAIVSAAVPALAEMTILPVGAYANLGTVDETVGWEADESFTGERYAATALGWLRSGARIVGGCCGTRPHHIAALRQAIDVAPVQASLTFE